MTDDQIRGLFGVGLVFFAIFLLVHWGFSWETERMQREAIKRGLARYNPKTANWEWLTKEDSK